MTLTGNVTSSTLSNASAGQLITFLICQDGTGGRTFAWPANFQNAPTIVSGANECGFYPFYFDGTNAKFAGQNMSGGGGGGSWGAITGTLSNQTDLQGALDGKVPTTRTISVTAPLTGGGDLSADRTLGCAVASGSQAGCLSSADWTTFNNKQDALGFTPENSANKGAASGYASLNASSKVVEDPASAQTAPAASKIPIADTNGKIADGWLSSSFPRVLYVYNCTTAGTCDTEANATGTGGAKITDDTSAANEVWFDAQFTVPANFLASKKNLRVTALVEAITQASSPQMTFKLYWGGTTGTVLMATPSGSLGVSTTRLFNLTYHVQGTAAPGASVSVETGAALGGGFNGSTAQPVTAATNADKVIILSGQWSSNATNTHVVRLRQLLIEELN